MTDMTWIRLELPDWLHRRLKAKAALNGTTLREHLTEVLRQSVEEDDDKEGTGK